MTETLKPTVLVSQSHKKKKKNHIQLFESVTRPSLNVILCRLQRGGGGKGEKEGERQREREKRASQGQQGEKKRSLNNRSLSEKPPTGIEILRRNAVNPDGRKKNSNEPPLPRLIGDRLWQASPLRPHLWPACGSAI